MHVLVTGASGFVGQSLCEKLTASGCTYAIIEREALTTASYSEHYDCIVHLAGRAHVKHDTADDIYQAYASVNIDYTLKVAELAKELKIRRFVFLSSIKVNGEESAHPYTETDTPAPMDAYGQTKLEAELSLKSFCDKHQIELIIIRPPLIYGPGAKANFKQLIKLCSLSLPLPFASIKNKRSFISLENLTNFILLCCTHMQAANQTFLISDDEDVSLPELIRAIRSTRQRPSLLFPLPVKLLKISFALMGQPDIAAKLFGTLQVDIRKAKTLLGWQPTLSFRDGIRQTLKEK
jgi:UDP-glucose 4-epimerase